MGTDYPRSRALPRLRRLIAILSLGLFLACGTREGDPKILEFWAVGREGEVVRALLPEFERRHPGISVRVQQIPWNAAHEKFLTAYAGDSLPDVLQLGNTWIPEFVALNALEELSSRLGTKVPAEDFFAGILDTNRIDGRLYGIPWYVDTRLLFYRKDLLQAAGYPEPPRTWREWWAAMKDVRAAGSGERFAILAPLNEWQVPVILALQLGATLLRDEDRYGDFESAPFRAAFSAYLGLFHQGLAPAVGDVQLGNLYQEFARGQFVFYLTGPWNLGEFERRLPPDLAGRWSTAPLPTPDDRYPGLSLAGGASLAIARTSARQDAAWALIEFLSEPAMQERFYGLTGDLPPRRLTWQSAALADNARAAPFQRQLERVVPLPRIPEWERIAAKIAHYGERAARGELVETDALAHLNRDVDQILEKRRWLLARRRR